MKSVPDSLAQHLAHWAAAFGADFSPPSGRAMPRPEAPAVPGGADDAAANDPSTAAAPRPGARRDAPNPKNAPGAATAPRSERRQAEVGDRNAHVLFLDGASDERAACAAGDGSGRPSDSPAGQLLQRIILSAMGLKISDVHVAACADLHREPTDTASHLDQVIQSVQPMAIVCLGRSSAQSLLGSTETTTALRSRQHAHGQTPVFVTWHPEDLLREPARKRDTWQDIKRVNRLLGLPEVPRGA